MYTLYRPYFNLFIKVVVGVSLLANILFFSGCNNKKEYSDGKQHELLTSIEAIMLQYPEQLDSLMPKIDTLHLTRCDSARYFLIKGFYNGWNGHYARSIHEISASEAIFSDLGDVYHQNLNNLVKAFTFEYLNLENDAANLYLSCNEYFRKEKLEKLKVYSTLGLIRLSNVLNLDKEALIDQAKTEIKKQNCPIFEGLFYSALGNIEPKDSLRISFFELAKKDFIRANSLQRIYGMEINILLPKIRQDHSDQMEQYYLQLVDKYSFYTPTDNQKFRFKFVQGYLYYMQGKYKEAVLIFEKILKDINSKKLPEIELDCIKFLVVLNLRSGNYKEASEYQYRQSELEKENKDVLRQNQILALSSHYRFTELEQEKLALKQRNKNYIFLFGIITLVFTFILVVTRFSLKQSRLEQEIVKLRNADVEEQLENLSQSLDGEKIKNQYLIDKVEEMKYQYKDSRLITKLKMEVETGQITLWNDFDERFMELRHVWLKNLKEQVPQLSNTEIMYCKCFYMEFSNATCAAIYCASIDAIRITKKRLRKKLSLDEASNIHEFLRSFE